MPLISLSRSWSSIFPMLSVIILHNFNVAYMLNDLFYQTHINCGENFIVLLCINWKISANQCFHC